MRGEEGMEENQVLTTNQKILGCLLELILC